MVCVGILDGLTSQTIIMGPAFTISPDDCDDDDDDNDD